MVVCALLATLATGTAEAATQTASSRAVTLRPLSIVKISDLEFGTMIAGTTSGTVIIDPTTDARTTTGGTIAAGGAPKAAQFLTYGTQNSVLQVTRGPLPVLTRAGGGASMNVTQLTLNGPVTRVVNPAGVLTCASGARWRLGQISSAAVTAAISTSSLPISKAAARHRGFPAVNSLPLRYRHDMAAMLWR